MALKWKVDKPRRKKLSIFTPSLILILILVLFLSFNLFLLLEVWGAPSRGNKATHQKTQKKHFETPSKLNRLHSFVILLFIDKLSRSNCWVVFCIKTVWVLNNLCWGALLDCCIRLLAHTNERTSFWTETRKKKRQRHKGENKKETSKRNNTKERED